MNVAFERGSSTGLAPWSAALLSARGVLLVFSLYCLIHFVLRLLLGAPVFLFARLLGGRTSRQRVHAFVLAVFTVTGLVIMERALNPYLWPEHCPKCRRFVPYPELAEQLRARGVPEDLTLIARDDNVAGNLAVQFPRAVTLSTDIILYYQPRPRPDRGCLIAWGDHRAPVEVQVPAEVRERLEGESDARLGAARRDAVVTAALVGAPQRLYQLAYIHAPPGDPRCPRRIHRP